jgi:hypothetical protein
MLTQAPWSKNVVAWNEGQTVNVSVPFTWLLPNAWSACVWSRSSGYTVRAGGPAVSLMPDYLKDVAEIGGEVHALPWHNRHATFTSRGCIRRCPFCAVPRIEGDLRELDDWEARPIVCDNNLLACSRAHFDKVIDRLKPIPGVDFNQGLDARLLTDYHIERIRELDLQCVRFAWDSMANEDAVHDAIFACLDAGIPKDKIRCYVLVGTDSDTPEDARCRCETLKAAGITKPNVQRYQPLDTLVKDSFVGKHWTDKELKRFCRYWNRQAWLGGVDYKEYARC